MLNRIFLGIVVVLSILWIAYIGFDILSDTHNYKPNSLFGNADEKVLIINRPNEVNLLGFSDFSNAPSVELYQSLDKDLVKSVIISAKRDHLLILGNEYWSEKNIKELLSSADLKLSANAGEVTIGDYHGRYFRKNLYIEKNIVPSESTVEQFVYDKKSSASLIHFDQKSAILSVSDIYLRDNNRVDYITHNNDIQQGNQVKDEVVFSSVVSNNFSTYHFLERDYYALQDSLFVNGPMFQWMQNGFLELNYEGVKVLVSDYIAGQDPILTLNELSQTTDTNHFSIRLTKDFPANNRSYTVKYLEDLVVISEKSEICDKMIADFKLGRTIALNKGVRDRLFGMLPQSVSERLVSDDLSYSKTAYQGKLLETKLDHNISLPTANDLKQESISMNCGFTIQDFEPLSKPGNLVALGTKGEVARFKNGKLTWTKTTGAPVIGGVQVIDLYQTGEQFIVVNSKDAIHLWNMDGKEVSGFPVNLENDAINQVKFYRWNGKSYFLIATDDNKVIHLDGKGRELNIIKVPILITRQIDVWASQHKLFAGFANDTKFIMYNVDDYKIHREFDLPGRSLSLKVPNELYQFSFNGAELIKISQKGVQNSFEKFDRPVLLDIQRDNNSNVIILKSANVIHLLNDQGIPFGEIPLSFNEVADVFIKTNNSGKTVVAIVDGLENNVYLYGLDGKLLSDGTIEGQDKVVLSSENGRQVITTIADEFVIQYLR